MPEKFNEIQVMNDVGGFFTAQQLKDIFSKAKRERDKILIRLLIKSGRRISEVIQCKKGDIDFDNKMVCWVILKKKKLVKKWKPIDSETLELLSAYVLKGNLLDPNYYLLHNGNPLRHITRQRAFQIIRQCSKDAGIDMVGTKKPHPHHFRHTFSVDIARKMKSPSDIRKLQMLLEHSSLNVTEQYLQFSDLDLRDLIEDKPIEEEKSKGSLIFDSFDKTIQ